MLRNYNEMKMLKTRLREIEDSGESIYWKCVHLYFDENDEPVNYTTTSTTTTTRRIVRHTTPTGYQPPFTNGLDDNDDAEQKSIILWSSIGTTVVVVLFILVICGLIASRRSERQKRKRTEAEYRVIATTLTSISTDMEDGTTYEELSSMSEPAYREHVDVVLPSRKQRQRMGGVSSGFTSTVKRWFSVEGNEPTKNAINTNSNGFHATIRPPLPSIPETQMSILHRSKSDKRVSAHNGEYVEIGPGNLRRSNIYNPLDGVTNPVQDQYDELRKSTLLIEAGDYPRLKADPAGENRQSAAYFILEKQEKPPNTESDPSDNYFILEKSGKDKSGEIAKSEVPETTATETNTEEPLLKEKTILPVNDGDQTIDKVKDDYYVLSSEPKTRLSSGNDEYLEPTDKHRHSYIEVLPEHKEMCKRTKK